jgi:hypothetical protein
MTAWAAFDRAGPLGLRRPGSDELAQGPFSRGRRSERPSPAPVRTRTLGYDEFPCRPRTERVRNDKEHWLVLTRSPVAGFNPIRDTQAKPLSR